MKHADPGRCGLAGRDTLVVVAIDRIGRRWPDTIRSICELQDLGVKIRSLAETGVGIIGRSSETLA